MSGLNSASRHPDSFEQFGQMLRDIAAAAQAGCRNVIPLKLPVPVPDRERWRRVMAAAEAEEALREAENAACRPGDSAVRRSFCSA